MSVVKLTLVAVIFTAFLMGCSTVSTQIIKVDEEYHKFIFDTAKVRMKYVSCDLGLLDGLGLTSSVDFPIKNGDDVKALLNNPGINIAISEIKDIAKTTNDELGNPYWKEDDYKICKAQGLGVRAMALSIVDILKLFPSLSPYLAILGQ